MRELISSLMRLMSESLISKIDEPKRAAHESISKAQAEMVGRTLYAVNLNASDELVQKTSASLSNVVATGTGPA
jgi:hypothetical protein